MKYSIAIWVACLVVSLAARADEFDKGGTSFDFQRISAQRFGGAANPDAHLLQVILAPMSLLDNTFCLSSHDPAILVFTFRRIASRDAYDKAEVSNLTLCLELPVGVDLRSTHRRVNLLGTEDTTIDGAPFKRYRIDFTTFREFPKNNETYLLYPFPTVLVYASAPAGVALPDGRYWMEDHGKPLTRQESFALHVLPTIQFGPKPEIFLNGFDNIPGQKNMEFSGQENLDLLGRFVGRGCNLIAGEYDPQLLASFRTNGVRFVVQDLWMFANAYKVAPDGEKEKPADAKFVTFPPDKFKSSPTHGDVNQGICPTAVYTESAYYQNAVVPWLTRKLRGYDGLLSNWEPWMFDGQGCYCDRCRDEFIRFSKAPEAEVKKDWPQSVMGRKYHDEWIKFRAWQHARVMETYDRTITAASSGTMGFLPGVAYCTMADSPFGRDFSQEWRVALWAANFKYIVPWGPYPWWPALQPYVYTKAFNLQTFVCAQKVREWTDKTCPDPARRPKQIAYPTALQLDFRLVQPEQLAMDDISFLLNGYTGVLPYSFPCGFDNRYWAELARVNHQAVVCEKYVFRGTRFPGFTSVAETPYPAPLGNLRGMVGWFPEMKDVPVSLLQTAGYALGGNDLAAIGNFWEKSDAFVRLKAAGLDPAARYVVTEPERRRFFAANDNDFYTGAELAATGVLTHVGALRWAFFAVEPYVAGHDYGRRISVAQVTAAVKTRLPEIARAAAFEQARDDKDAFQKTVLRKVSSGALTCEPKTVTGDQGEELLSFTNGAAVFNLATDGMLMRGWKIGGQNLIASVYGKKWGFAAAAFWRPWTIVIDGYHITSLEPTDTGITVIAERDADPSLNDLALTQKYEIDRDLRRVRVTTTVRNDSSAEAGNKALTLGFRYHGLPACLANPDGTVTMKNDAQEVIFKRRYKKTLYARAGSPAAAEMRALYQVTDVPAITGPDALLTTPGGLPVLQMTLAPAKAFGGFGCWDDVASHQAASFEPFFNPITLQPGKTAVYELTLVATPGK